MRRVNVDLDGGLHCRECGSSSLFARHSEQRKRRKCLRCADCGTRQRHWERRSIHS